MRNILKPDQVAESIYDIDLKALWDSGYHYMIVDIDNTITAWNQYHTNPTLKDWIHRAKGTGFRICLLSNNKQEKVRKFASDLGVLAAPGRGKPSPGAFRSALSTLGESPGDTLVIGDQIFTDILGGNRAGLYTILVDPIDDKEFIGTKFARVMERLLAGRRPVCKSHKEQR